VWWVTLFALKCNVTSPLMFEIRLSMYVAQSEKGRCTPRHHVGTVEDALKVATNTRNAKRSSDIYEFAQFVFRFAHPPVHKRCLSFSMDDNTQTVNTNCTFDENFVFLALFIPRARSFAIISIPLSESRSHGMFPVWVAGTHCFCLGGISQKSIESNVKNRKVALNRWHART
jgi:hypothetical protein